MLTAAAPPAQSAKADAKGKACLFCTAVIACCFVFQLMDLLQCRFGLSVLHGLHHSTNKFRF